MALNGKVTPIDIFGPPQLTTVAAGCQLPLRGSGSTYELEESTSVCPRFLSGHADDIPVSTIDDHGQPDS